MSARQYILSVDIGRSIDHTALTAQKRRRPVLGGPEKFEAFDLEQMQTGVTYESITGRIIEKAIKCADRGSTAAVIDATGVGAPLVEKVRSGLRARPDILVVAIVITGGTKVARTPHGYNVPKTDIIDSLVMLLEERRLLIARTVPAMEEAIDELRKYGYKLTKSQHETSGGMGKHDDIVLSLALGCWYATRPTVDADEAAPRGSSPRSIEDMQAFIDDPMAEWRPTDSPTDRQMEAGRIASERARAAADAEFNRTLGDEYERVKAKADEYLAFVRTLK